MAQLVFAMEVELQALLLSRRNKQKHVQNIERVTESSKIPFSYFGLRWKMNYLLTSAPAGFPDQF